MQKKPNFSKHKPIVKLQDKLNERNFYDQNLNNFSEKVSRKLILPWIVIAIIFFSLGTQLFLLQVKEGFVNLRLAEGNRVKSIPVAGARGLIVDSKGQILASNSASYVLIARINKLRDVDKVSDDLFSVIGLSREQVKEEIKKQSFKSGYSILREKIPRDEALVIKSRLPVYGEFEISPTFIREYTEPSLAHLLGYVGKLNKEEQESKPIAAVNGICGKSGIEKVYDDFLQGNPGSHKAEVDASNRLVRLLSEDDAQIGKTLKTSINKDLQSFAYQRLKEEAEKKQTKGALVIQDPRNGAILAMVSIPLYDNSLISRGITQKELDEIFKNPNRPFLNRAIGGVYPSGSSIKPFIATTALENGVIDEGTSFETPPFIEVGKWKFPDWKDHGVTNVKTAIAQSNNIFFYALGGGYNQSPIKRGLGPDGIKKGLEKFGYGQKTGIDLAAEESGFLPTPEWKKKTTGESWYIGNTYHMAIGQGDLLVTPLQVANATSAIANNGKLFRPFIVQEILDSEGKKIISANSGEKLISDDIFSKDNLRIVRDGMRQTVQSSGSAYGVFGSDFPVEVAAKTGTAQFGAENKTHAWFTSFAPYSDPQVVVTVIVEAAGEGYEAAAPVARDIIRWWNDHK